MKLVHDERTLEREQVRANDWRCGVRIPPHGCVVPEGSALVVLPPHRLL